MPRVILRTASSTEAIFMLDPWRPHGQFQEQLEKQLGELLPEKRKTSLLDKSIITATQPAVYQNSPHFKDLEKFFTRKLSAERALKRTLVDYLIERARARSDKRWF